MVHYKFEITDPHEVFWLVEIKDTAYTGSTETDLSNTSGADGFTLKWEGGDPFGQSAIISSEMSFQLDISTASLALFDAIISGNECRFIIQVYKEGVCYWRGFILKDDMSKPDAANNTDFLGFKCTDGFGLLKDINYSGFDINALTRYTFTQWMVKIGSKMPLNYVTNTATFINASIWYEADHASTSTDDPLNNTLINEIAFLKVDQYGVVEPFSYYDILTALLNAFNLQVSQWGGVYFFRQPNVYEQASTRQWIYDKAGNFISTSLFTLHNTMQQRMAGGSFDYVIPIKEVTAEYEYRQSVYKNNFFPAIVDRATTYNLGASTQNARIDFSGQIETRFTGSGGDLANICAVYQCTIRNGSHYLKSVDLDYVWTTDSADTVTIRTASIKSDYPIEQVRITDFAFGAELPEEGTAITFLWDFYQYEYLTTGLPWSDIANTNTATHESIEGSFVSVINTGIPQDGTQLYKATVNNSARADIALETAILGDGANKYSAGAIFINNGSSIVQADAWTLYSGIGGTPLHLTALQCREILALRRSTVQVYNGAFDGSPDINRGFLWEGKYYAFSSIEWNCFDGEYQFTAYAVVLDRTSITNTLPLTSQSSSGGSGGSTGGTTSPTVSELWEVTGDTLQPKEGRGIDFSRDTPCIVVFSTDSNATESESFDGSGVVGRSTNLDGVNGESTWGAGVRGSSTNDYGVRGNSARFGDDTDNVTIDTIGNIKLNGRATVFDDLTVPGMQTKKTGSNQPDFKQVAGGIYIDTFPPNSFAEVFFSVQLPHSYKEGSDVSAHVHWMPMASVVSSMDVIWKLEYEWRNINDTFSGASTTTLTATAPSGTPGYKHLLSEFPDITGTGKTRSSIIICRLYRDATNVLDTYTSDAGLLAIDFRIEKDALGSNSEYTK